MHRRWNGFLRFDEIIVAQADHFAALRHGYMIKPVFLNRDAR